MTTVGYGDYFPKSIPGRVIVFCVCILGTTLISLIVFLMTGFLEMTEAETKVMNIVIRMQKREGIKKEAAFVLSTVAKLALVTRKMKKETDLIKKEIISKEVVIMQEKVKLHFERFRRFTRFLSLFKLLKKKNNKKINLLINFQGVKRHGGWVFAIRKYD